LQYLSQRDPKRAFRPRHSDPAQLDREADLLLSLGRYRRAEELSSRALEMRQTGNDRQQARVRGQ
jgi:hypothetical protein